MNNGYYGNRTTKESSTASALLSAADAMTVFTKASNPNSYLSDMTKLMDSAYKEHITGDAHGAYNVPGVAFIHAGQQANAGGTAQYVIDMAKSELNFNINNPFNGSSVIVYNTESYVRNEPITQTVDIPEGKCITGVKNASTGASVPYEVINVDGNEVAITFICDIAPYSHKLYNIVMSDGKQELNITQNTRLMQGGSAKGSGYNLTVGKNGEITSLTTSAGQKIISTENGSRGAFFTGYFYSITGTGAGTMSESTLELKMIYEGPVSTRFIASGHINSQLLDVMITVYKTLPYFDMKIIADFTVNCGIGARDPYEFANWGMTNDNTNQKKLNINFKPDFQLGGSFSGDTLNPSYPLYDYRNYNNTVNVSRYTPFYPEKFKRKSEPATLTGSGVGRTNHVYDILSRYYIDISSPNSDRGLSMFIKGGASFTYDGNTLGSVMAASSQWDPIDGTDVLKTDASYTFAGVEYTGDCLWDFRFLAHARANSATEVVLADGKTADLLKQGLGFNKPLLTDVIDEAYGELPAEYQYLVPKIGNGVIINSISLQNGKYYARAFEYNGQKAGNFAINCNGKTAAIKPVSMDYTQSRDDANKNLTQYKIGTYQLTLATPANSNSTDGNGTNGADWDPDDGSYPEDESIASENDDSDGSSVGSSSGSSKTVAQKKDPPQNRWLAWLLAGAAVVLAAGGTSTVVFLKKKKVN